MIAREIRQRSDKELASLAASLEDELFHFRMQNTAGQSDAGRIRKTRRDLARVMTVMRERGIRPLAGAPPAPAEKGGEE